MLVEASKRGCAMTAKTFPKADWQIAPPADVGMDSEKLNLAKGMA